VNETDWHQYIASDEVLLKRSENLEYGPCIDIAAKLSERSSKPLCVLDCGCGCGHLFQMFILNNIKHHYFGIDNNIEALIAGRKAYGALCFCKADLFHLPFRSNSIDIVIACDVLYMFKEVKTIIKDIFRIARMAVLIEIHLAPLGSNSLAMRLPDGSYTKLNNIYHHKDFYASCCISDPDLILHHEVPSTYKTYLGIPYRLRTLMVWFVNSG